MSETQMLPSDALTWTREPDPRLETVDVLTLNESELLSHVADLQRETAWLRQVLYEALSMVQRQRDQIARATQLVEFQRQQLRADRRIA